MTLTETLAIIGAASGSVGALAGVGALAWQIKTQRRAGRIVTVRSVNQMPLYGPPDAPEFRDDDQVAIVVTNSGSAPVTVTNYGVALGPRRRGTSMFNLNRLGWDTPLPAVAAPGGEPVTVRMPVRGLREAHRERGVPFKRMRPWVDLGDGRRVYSSNPVPLR